MRHDAPDLNVIAGFLSQRVARFPLIAVAGETKSYVFSKMR
jgi:hypothetical protein